MISAAFPIVATHTKALPFVVFALCTLVQAIVVPRFFPETRGVELEDMEKAVG